MENKCTFCDKEITNGDGIYIDDIAIDDVFCNRIIDLDEIEELNENTVIGCGQNEGDFLPCEGCPLENNPTECELLRIQKGLTKTTIKDIQL